MSEREIIETDVLVIGGGPGGLATAIHLADLIQDHNEGVEKGTISEKPLPLNVLLIDKGASFGSHSISGAVINPIAFKELLPDTPIHDIPFESEVKQDELRFLVPGFAFKAPFHPPYMSNQGNYVASLGKVVRWLANIAEQKGVQIFSGFAATELLYNHQGVLGACTGETGLDKHFNRMANYQAGNDIHAKITVLAEGSRGHLTKGLIHKFDLAKDRNPQVYSIGVKEVWEVPEGTFEKGRVTHTMGYPLALDQFGGGFIYGMADNQVAVGLVIGLDYRDPTFDPHHAFQVYKQHPFVKKILQKGKLLRYGAKTIPEGGLFSLPQLYHHGVMIVGDSAGFLSMPSLKGIHPAIQSGILAAKTAFEALKNADYSEKQLALYEELFKQSTLYEDLYPVRNFRQGFHQNLMIGSIHFGAQLVTGGYGLSLNGKLSIEEDAKCLQPLALYKNHGFMTKFKNKLTFDKQLTFDKVTDVFYSGTQHDEEQPCHCTIPDPSLCADVCFEKFGAPCQYFCPAEVYELVSDTKTGKKEIRIHPANCVHCKTCDIKDPLRNLVWTPPYGGDGPEYESM
ncbi:MAG: electron transfer flavoprotein-ubiquinone oxidoreductase [Candidatus Omnitrophica bacterium]|nr:electron transfer flavoprotein-ubiquinone oxidoreductase [Candidatus Omnitrophota bacterium]MDD5670155.1 electron transfer flavoprotein-ubiquinone oxidoreductase [Candidatus Omnitrophota bacterium]